MNGTFRQSMSWLHTWAGLTLGWILYFIFITGSAGYFDNEIDSWMRPEIPQVENYTTTQAEMLTLSEQHLAQYAPDTLHWYISFPGGRYPYLGVGYQNTQLEYVEDLLSPQTGRPLSSTPPRETGGGQLLYQMHYEFHYLPETIVDWLVSISTMLMLVALICGVVIHKKIFKEFFTFRPKKGQRSWLDMHNLFSVLSLPFQLMITYSGLLFFMYTTMPAIEPIASYAMPQDGIEQNRRLPRENSPYVIPENVVSLAEIFATGEEYWGKGNIDWIEVDEPGELNARVTIAATSMESEIIEGSRIAYDRHTGEVLRGGRTERSTPEVFYQVMTGLHIGFFAGPVLRWVYFISGLLGAGMVGTGLILWTVKRRRTAEKSGQPHKGLALVERLNVGTIIGLPIAIAVYFWANRLLPVGLESRAEWEVNALFLTWGITLLYPVFRSVQRAWIELLWLVTALYLLLPLLNLLTTERHLANSLLKGDWVMAGFDLTVLIIGLVFGVAALKVQNKYLEQALSEKPLDQEIMLEANIKGITL